MRPLDVIVGVDASAATSGYEQDILNHINGLIEYLKDGAPPIRFTLFSFKDGPSFTMIYERDPIDQVVAVQRCPIDHNSGVALWDAIDLTLEWILSAVQGTGESDSHRACFLFISAGGDNASCVARRLSLRSKIAYAWTRWRWSSYIVALSHMALQDAKDLETSCCNLHGMLLAVNGTRAWPHPSQRRLDTAAFNQPAANA